MRMWGPVSTLDKNIKEIDSKSRKRGWGSRHRLMEEMRPYCTFHRFYGHDTSECWDAQRSTQTSNSRDAWEDRTYENPQWLVSLGRDAGRTTEHMPWHCREEDEERPWVGHQQRKNQALATKNKPIREINTIIGCPHIGGNSRNVQRNYAR